MIVLAIASNALSVIGFVTVLRWTVRITRRLSRRTGA